MCFNNACTNQLYKQSRNMCVKCHMDRELPYGRKDFLRYIIRIPLLHILVNSLLCSANTTAKEVIFMSILLKNFAFSAKEFKCLKSIVAAALLVALHTVLAVFVSINVTPALRISVSFLANCAIGYMFGPVMGFMCGGLGDIIQYIIKPTGPYFPGWTLSAALAGLIYGLFFYDCNIKISKKKVTGEKRSLLEIIDLKFLIRVVLALTIDTLLVNVLLGTYWCSIMYGKGFMFYLTMRFTKNLIQLPINIFLTYNVIGIVKVINNKIYKNE